MPLPAPSPARTCLVTGASSGIGAHLARQLAQRGLGLTLVARREDRLRALAAELAAAHGVRAEVIAADVSDADWRAGLVKELDNRGLAVDVLVNNAGFGTTGPVDQADHGREVAMIRTNVEAVADLCTLVLPGMVERRQGWILNVASTAAFQPLPGQAAYAATKAFVLSYSHSLRAELSGKGVTVTVLCPGPVDTEFADQAGFSAGEAEGAAPKVMWVPAERVAQLAVQGLDRGRAQVIPGLANRLTATGGQHTPRRLTAAVVARVHPALRRSR